MRFPLQYVKGRIVYKSIRPTPIIQLFAIKIKDYPIDVHTESSREGKAKNLGCDYGKERGVLTSKENGQQISK